MCKANTGYREFLAVTWAPCSLKQLLMKLPGSQKANSFYETRLHQEWRLVYNQAYVISRDKVKEAFLEKNRNTRDCKMDDYEYFIKKAIDLHGGICVGIALGTRMTLAAMRYLEFDPYKNNRKNIIAFAEIDRCMTDAVQAITGCSLGRRSLKHVDYGRFAVTLVNLNTGKAVRATVKQVFSSKADKNETLNMIATSPDDELVTLQAVVVDIPEFDLPGSPRKTIICHACGERVVDGRDVEKGGVSLCRACAGDAYYTKAAATPRDNPAAQNAS